MNKFETYMCTVEEKAIRLEGASKIIFNNPITAPDGTLLEVSPVLNLAKTNRSVYLMNIYYNAVKLFARHTTVPKKISKHTTKVNMFYGLSSKEVVVYSKKIQSIRNTKYYNIDRIMTYIIAQTLYEAIEEKPFLMDTTRQEERKIRKVKFYISKAYRDYRMFILDYLCCRRDAIQRKIALSSDMGSLEDLERELRKEDKKA